MELLRGLLIGGGESVVKTLKYNYFNFLTIFNKTVINN